MKKIYISGKITGDQQYKQKFNYAAILINAAGYKPINPAEEHLPDGATWADYMRHDIKLLCDSDGLYMLKDWQESKGARLEHQLAQELGLKIYYEGAQKQVLTGVTGLDTTLVRMGCELDGVEKTRKEIDM